MSASNLNTPYRPILNGADVIRLVHRIEQWGIDRNITHDGGATVESQLEKGLSEYEEAKWTLEELATNARLTSQEEAELQDNLNDDFGDMLVCLIQAMRLANTDMVTCLEKAWGDIKDRKGTMVDGQFVKES